MFTSSITIFRSEFLSAIYMTAANLRSPDWSEGTIAPEEPSLRPVCAIGSGYTESKWVTESILERAAERTALRPVIVRVGQLSQSDPTSFRAEGTDQAIGGSRNGRWKHTEWLPVLVRSGQILRCLPRPAGVRDPSRPGCYH